MEDFLDRFNEVQIIIGKIGTPEQVKALQYCEDVLFPLFHQMEEVQNEFIGAIRMMEHEHERNLALFQGEITGIVPEQKFEA